jgi:hypothetical protein
LPPSPGTADLRTDFAPGKDFAGAGNGQKSFKSLNRSERSAGQNRPAPGCYYFDIFFDTQVSLCAPMDWLPRAGQPETVSCTLITGSTPMERPCWQARIGIALEKKVSAQKKLNELSKILFNKLRRE